MAKKAGTVKAKKGSKTQSDKPAKPAADQPKTGEEAAAAPSRMQSFLRLAKGGVKPQPEAAKKVQVLTARTKEVVPKTVRKEAGSNWTQFFRESGKFFLGAWAELKKVHWPTRQELVVYTVVVLCSVIFVGLLIWIADSILSKLLNFIL